MANEKVTVVYSNHWFLPALTVLLIGLKLTHIIQWSWWLVLAPIWGAMALFLALYLFAIGVAAVAIFGAAVAAVIRSLPRSGP